MATKKDPEQARLDLEDAVLRLRRMQDALKAKDEADGAVKDLQLKLAQAKRRQKEAGWNLIAVMNAERRAARVEGQ